MRSMLVTGAAGFIGANFVRYVREQYPDDKIVIVDSLTYAGNPHNLDGVLGANCHLIQADINNTDYIMRLLREHQINTIVHFAAETHVDRSITGPDAFIEANILGTYSLLKAARQVWQIDKKAIEEHRFHHVSTDEVYGQLMIEDPAFTEDTAYAPNSPYSASKASSDFLVRSFHHTFGMQVTTSNCSNNYGPYQFPEKLIPLMIINVLHGKSLPVYGDGKNVRDWLYVEDHAIGIDMVLQNGRIGETYNIGGCNEWTNIDIVNLICALIDKRFESNHALCQSFPDCPAAQGEASNSLINYVTDRAGHDFRYAIDTAKIQSELGYKPKVTFEAGIEKTLDWYLENSGWWEAVLDGSYRGEALKIAA